MPPSRASPPAPKLIRSQSLRGHTPHVSRQYCWRRPSVNGRSGKRSVTLLLENVRLISVQACGTPHTKVSPAGRATSPRTPVWHPGPGNPRPWRQGPSRSLWGPRRPGTVGRCHSRAPCPRSCTPALVRGALGLGACTATLPPRWGTRAREAWGSWGRGSRLLLRLLRVARRWPGWNLSGDPVEQSLPHRPPPG